MGDAGLAGVVVANSGAPDFGIDVFGLIGRRM
jgi:hypothetical protein